MQLTMDEKRLLKQLFIDEKRIEEGKLFPHQIKCLEEIRFSCAYLKKQYNKEFYILSYAPIYKMQNKSEMYFKEGESIYSLSVEEINGQYVAKDNYYISFLTDRYNLAIASLMKEKFNLDCQINVKFISLSNIVPSISMEEVFALGSKLNRYTKIQVDADNEMVKEKVQTLAKEYKLYGSYQINQTLSFQCFDVE